MSCVNQKSLGNLRGRAMNKYDIMEIHLHLNHNLSKNKIGYLFFKKAL